MAESWWSRWWPWSFDADLDTIDAIAATALLLFVLWIVWWKLPQWQRDRFGLPDEKARADVEDNFRKTISQLIGGTAVLAGAVFAYMQFQQQQQSSHEVLISNQVAKGFEQLGSTNILVRIGGVYALTGVMNTSQQYYKPILGSLCAFVREGTMTAKGDKPLATDIQAALTEIGSRAIIGTEKPFLRNVIIPGANLRDANLRGADLVSANLFDADMRGADLAYAYPIGANLNSAILTGANLYGAYLSMNGFDERGTLIEADLTGANLSNAYLDGTDLTGANLTGANLTGASLTGSKVSQTNLSNAYLDGTDLTDANLTGANLTGANLTGASLTGSTVSQTQLDTACGVNVKLDPRLTIKPCKR
jgi:uncharacterized protein YjbI with pentapeptide repeats